MTIFGKRLSEYVAFCSMFLGIILVVGIARFALSIGGAPNSLAKWVSISGAVLIGTVFYAIRVRSTGFGSYKQLLPIVFLMQGAVAQTIICIAIMVAIFTGHENIYSAPEYGGGGNQWAHIIAHLTLGAIVGTLIVWLVGCVIMFVYGKLAGSPGSRV